MVFYTVRKTEWPKGALRRRSSPLAWRIYDSRGTGFIGMQYRWGRRFDGAPHHAEGVTYSVVPALLLRAIEGLNWLLCLLRPLSQARHPKTYLWPTS